MKKYVFLSILFIVSHMAFSQITDQFSSQTSDYTIVTKSPYTFVESKESDGYTSIVGAPKLPVSYRSYALPAGSTVTNITFSNGSKTLLGDTFYLYPTQSPCIGNGKPCPDFVIPDVTIYNSTTSFPSATATLVSDVSTFGYHMVTVDICPFQYIPLERKLYLYNEINITINYSIGQIEYEVSISEQRSQLAKEFVQSSVQNPEMITPSARSANLIIDSQPPTDKLILQWKPSSYGKIPDFIIITNNDLKPAFDDLATYKIKKGISTLVTTVEQIYANYPGCDNAEKVRNYLKAARYYWGSALYVLLGGDTAAVPGRMAVKMPIPGTIEWNYTDMYFCDVYKYTANYNLDTDNYNWNSDGDSDFAWDEESTPTQVELGPDNFIGRAPADTPEEAENFVTKVIAYENPPASLDTTYFNNMLFLGAYQTYNVLPNPNPSNLYNNPNGQAWHYKLSLEPFLSSPSLKKWLVLDDPQGTVYSNNTNFPNRFYVGNQDLNSENTLMNLKNGQFGIGKFHLVSHFDHGSPYGIGTSGGKEKESIFNADMDELRNDPYYKIMYSTACEDGTFQKDCFAEHFVNAEDGGGVAMLANSGSVYADGYKQDKLLFQSIYGNLSTKSHIMGVAFANARIAVPDRQKIKHLTLFGDPTMATWSATPLTIALYVPTTVSIDNATSNVLQVMIDELINEATVTLYKLNTVSNIIEVFATQIIPAGSTSVNFELNPDTAGIMQVKVTAKNYLPASAEVNILLPQAHLYVTSYSITDNAPNGNGNGIIEQGETVTMSIQITNSGLINSTGINTVLSCLPIFATVTNNQVSVPQINSGQTVTLNGFSFVAQVEQVGTRLPDFIEFWLNITASGSYVHLDNFYVELKNPKLILGARNVTNDAADSNIKNLNVFLSNTGNVATGVLTATLSSPMVDSGIIQITNAIRTYPTIEALTEQKNSEAFVFKFLQSHSGSQPFTLTLSNSVGRSWSFSFDLSEGMPPLITGFKYTSTNDQINLTWDPITTMRGYNVYRSDTEIGGYSKINPFLITGTSMYNDVITDNRTTFYYKISAVTISGNERPLDIILTTGATPNLQGYKAWTSLDYNGGFPRGTNTGQVCFVNSFPTLFDVDNDGKKEIFINSYNGADDKGVILGFYESGQEMYNIDGNESTVSGFATTNINMVPNSAVGDLDNDGHAEVLSIGRNTSPAIAAGPNRGKLYVYKTIDANTDGQPDKFWDDETIDFGWKVSKNPVLYDVNADGYLEIIVVDERQNVWVYDRNKNVLPGWPIQVGATDWAQGSIAVADLDHDGQGEIALGVRSGIGTKGAVYIWHHDGTPFTVNPFHEFAENERADSAIVFADIDNDLNLDLLTSTKNGTTGKIYAFKQDGNPVGSLWGGTTTFTVPNDSALYQDHIMPKLAIGDLNHDGSLEIVFTSRNFLHVLDKDGQNVAAFNSPKSIEDNGTDNSPVLADIDGNTDGNREIIINNNGKIYAYNYSNGTACARYPLASEDDSPFMGTPAIADIDNDGKNEIVIATRSAFTYAYKTNGDSDKIDWGSYRGNPSNTGTYKEVCNNQLDLCIKDAPDDRGAEPNTTTQFMWGSSDIWVRNNNDTSLEHENPRYRANSNPNFIKVRVTNKSCVQSTGTETLTLYWAKASTGLGWYDPWHGNILNEFGAEMGHDVGTLQIPPMQKGQEIVLSFPWIVPNPTLYGTDGDQWHFCLLAQINGGETDPFTFPLIPDLNQNVRNNNNLAWKNVTVVNVPELITVEPAGVVEVANPAEVPKTYYLELQVADLETGKPIYDEAEVKLKMDEVLYRAWEIGGKEAQLLDPTTEEKRKIVKGNHVILDNISFGPKQSGKLRLTFNFLTKELTQKTNYVYNVIQRDVQTGEVIGGETFIINKNARTPFEADAGGDKEVDLNQPITISAADINEPAIYNWYDSGGNLVFQGKDLQIASAIAEKYKLEVISTIDGFKDYTEIEIKLNPNRLNSIAPNPAADKVNVSYKLNNASSAYLMIVSYYISGGISNNYVLDVSANEATINLNNYPMGFYKVILVADGNIVDAKLLFKQ